MRFVDVLLRHGHLSEHALVDAIMTGDAPEHLERCEICSSRAVEINRWLESVRDEAAAATDAVFPAERLTAQQAEIARRLAQLDEPSRVIAFPNPSRATAREASPRRVAPGWIGVAATIGLVIGAVVGQASAHLTPQSARIPASSAPAATMPAAEPRPADAGNVAVLTMDLEAVTPDELGAMNDITPRIQNIVAALR